MLCVRAETNYNFVLKVLRSPSERWIGNTVFVSIFAGFSREGVSNESGAVKNVDFPFVQMV